MGHKEQEQRQDDENEDHWRYNAINGDSEGIGAIISSLGGIQFVHIMITKHLEVVNLHILHNPISSLYPLSLLAWVNFYVYFLFVIYTNSRYKILQIMCFHMTVFHAYIPFTSIWLYVHITLKHYNSCHWQYKPKKNTKYTRDFLNAANLASESYSIAYKLHIQLPLRGKYPFFNIRTNNQLAPGFPECVWIKLWHHTVSSKE